MPRPSAPTSTSHLAHPTCSRRVALQAGAIGLLGLGANHLAALRTCLGAPGEAAAPRARSVIYIFLSGGLAQHESFDLKPEAPEQIRGEFRPIDTATPGIQICEHLPLLAQRSRDWALVRSLTHPYNEHSQGHLVMLTGRAEMPIGFDPTRPKSSDWPSLAAVAGRVTTPRNNLPPAVVLPERLIHNTGRVIPGQFAGTMGPQHDPWFVEASPYNSRSYGAYPQFLFHHEKGKQHEKIDFQAPHLSLPQGLAPPRLQSRLDLLAEVEKQRRALEAAAEEAEFDRFRAQAVSLLAQGPVQKAFDVAHADARVLERYGQNSFGWSLWMARQLVEAGVNLVQVNLGNDETWDTHQSAFVNLREFLLPPMDRAVSALLDDLRESGLLDSTLVVMAGEFGRTPRIFSINKQALPGRDHWGAAQSVWFAGGGVRGGQVIGATDKIGAAPAADPQTPEQMAATIYRALGIPASAAWHDAVDRPHQVYHGEPIAGLM